MMNKDLSGCNKFYKLLDKAGKDFKDAVQKSYDRCSYNPAFIDDWISDQQDDYMKEDWDGERFYKIVWDMEDKKLLALLERLKIDLNYPEGLTRIELDNFIRKRNINKEERVLLKELKKAFEKDLENKRSEWAWERASDDFDIFWQDCKTDEDFYEMGFDTSIEGYEDVDGECVAEKDIMGVCNCNKFFTKEYLPKISEDPSMNNDNYLYCDECEASYSIGELTPELKETMNKEIVMELL